MVISTTRRVPEPSSQRTLPFEHALYNLFIFSAHRGPPAQASIWCSFPAAMGSGTSWPRPGLKPRKRLLKLKAMPRPPLLAPRSKPMPTHSPDVDHSATAGVLRLENQRAYHDECGGQLPSVKAGEGTGGLCEGGDSIERA